MIVKPTIIDNAKYRALRSALGPTAMEVLIALWGHVENASGSNPDNILDDAEEIAHICRYRGNAKRLKDALLFKPDGCDSGVLCKTKTAGILNVHGWMDQNAAMVQRRNAGKKGGRPCNRTETGGGGSGYGSGYGSGLNGEKAERNRREGKGGEGNNPPNPLVWEWVREFLVELQKTEKFPALTIEVLLDVVRGYPKADLVNSWRGIVLEASAMPGNVVSAPVPWLRKAISRVEVENLKKIKRPVDSVDGETKPWTPDERNVLPPGFVPASLRKKEEA